LLHQVIIGNEKLWELFPRLVFLDHGMDPLKIQKIAALEQFPHLWEVGLGDKPLAFALGQGIPKQDVLLPAKVRLIDIFAVEIGRVAVEEGILPVIVGDQCVEALILNDDIRQTFRHRFELLKDGTDIEGLAGETLSRAIKGIPGSHKEGRGPPHIPVVRTLLEGGFQFLRPLFQEEPVNDFQLGRKMLSHRIFSGFKPLPLFKFLSGVERQKIQFQQEFRGPVPNGAEQIDQSSVNVVIDLKFARLHPQHNSAGAAKDIDIAPEFPWEYGVKDRQKVCLVADAGNGCSDRLIHTP